MSRLFVAVKPPNHVLDHLEGAISLIDWSALRPVGRINWHITLCFLGETPEGAIPDLCEGLHQVPKSYELPQLELSGAGTFFSKMLCVGVQATPPKTLDRLASDIADAVEGCGLQLPDSRKGKFRPHLTLGRLASRSNQVDLRPWVQALSVYRGPSWTMNEFHLVESRLGEGKAGRPRYIFLERFSLTTAGMYEDLSDTSNDNLNLGNELKHKHLS